jgi:hypothetical protein
VGMLSACRGAGAAVGLAALRRSRHDAWVWVWGRRLARRGMAHVRSLVIDVLSPEQLRRLGLVADRNLSFS